MTIRFTKAHGAGNDFLLTWADEVPRDAPLPAIARAICDRHTSVGADGWMLVRRDSIRLFNADGSEPELSGNGTRCAAALLVHSGFAESDVTLLTGAGPKHLKLMERAGLRYLFEMDMGLPVFRQEELRFSLTLAGRAREVAIVNVGNPQCVVFVDDFPEDWRSLGAEIEGHAHFPKRTNVSFVRILDPHAIEVRFFERGVGETLSSGTGSTGAAVVAILRGHVQSPVRIQTPAGDFHLRWTDSVWLTGPAEITATGEFYFD